MKFFSNSRNLKLFSLTVLAWALILIMAALVQNSRTSMLVSFLDVGQGDAIFIEAPAGRQMLIDGGPNKAVLRELGQVLPFYDRSIDVVLMTHPDLDHIGGLVEVLKRYEVGLFVRTDNQSSSTALATIQEIIKEKNIPEAVVTGPQTIDLGQARFEILFPLTSVAEWDSNDSSIIGRLVFNGNSFLFTGDAPKKIEEYLVTKYGRSLQSTVFKAGHHGSNGSNSQIFLAAVAPAFSVVSAGLNNRYHHPGDEALQRLWAGGGKIFQTLGSGKISFELNGVNLTPLSDHYILAP